MEVIIMQLQTKISKNERYYSEKKLTLQLCHGALVWHVLFFFYL